VRKQGDTPTDTLTLTVMLGTAMRNEDHDAINRLLLMLEQRLSPEDIATILEGFCVEARHHTEPADSSEPLVACA
jgi:hypothetical protein